MSTNTSTDVLTVEKIMEAIRRVEPEWLAMIRDAETCTVKASEYIPDGNMYILQPPTFYIDDPIPAGRSGDVLVVCMPDQEEAVRGAVEQIRAAP
jgi:hypothetical protein